jgi:membrane-anchored protein YejM (alkaline phosphatase superfamily)
MNKYSYSRNVTKTYNNLKFLVISLTFKFRYIKIKCNKKKGVSMKLTKIVMALLAGSILASTAMADYNKGYKYFQKYVKKASGIKGTDFLKVAGIKTPDQVDELLKDNAKGLIEKLKKDGHKKAAKAIEKIVKKHKLNDLKDFLKGMTEGKIPAGC